MSAPSTYFDLDTLPLPRLIADVEELAARLGTDESLNHAPSKLCIGMYDLCPCPASEAGEDITSVVAVLLERLSGPVPAPHPSTECGPETAALYRRLLGGLISVFWAGIVAEVRERAARPFTREALMAALVARNAAIEGDAVAVDTFSRGWLGLSDPARWRGAVEMALLGDWVDALGRGITDDPVLLNLLHRHTRAEHRHLQPVWEHKVGGRRLRLLHEPVADGLVLADVLPDHRRPEDAHLAAELADSRLATVLRSLTAEEAAVALAYAADPKASWTEAATTTGHPAPEALGTRVRRKLKRLGERHTARAGRGGGGPMSGILHAALPEFLAGLAIAAVVAATTAALRALRTRLKRGPARRPPSGQRGAPSPRG